MAIVTIAWGHENLFDKPGNALLSPGDFVRCAVTGEKVLPVLEAAHIRPFAEYLLFHGRSIRVPDELKSRPSAEFLR